MKDFEIIKRLRGIQKEIDTLIKDLNRVKPFFTQVGTITKKQSEDIDVIASLKVIEDNTDKLLPDQFSFALYYLCKNRINLVEEISEFVKIQIGKHKYGMEREFFLREVILNLKNNFNDDVVRNSLIEKLSSYKN